MAENAVHSTSAVCQNKRPTIFDVLAQESLMATVRPALKHLLTVVSSHWPDTTRHVRGWFDEVYLIADVLIQNYFLLKYRASFSEKFFDLERSDGFTRPRLLSRQHIVSLLCLALCPYIKQKLDDLYETLTQFPATDTACLQLHRSFLRLYPYVHSSWQTLCLVYHVSYTLGWSACHSPSLRLAGLMLQRRDLSVASSTSIALFSDHKTLTDKLWFATSHGVQCTAMVLSNTLSIGIFFMQFLQSWYSRDDVRKSITSFPIPKPPQMTRRLPDGVTNQHCPLCRQIRTNHTALLVSGYVFCYPCIHRYVSENGQCPVTRYLATTDHIVKLYISDS